jgi:hypothetical protein
MTHLRRYWHAFIAWSSIFLLAVMDVSAGGWLTAEASWYGPGFYGNRTACGLEYTQTIVGVAHKTLPCGTRVTFRHAGNVVTAPVIDRGPYTAGRMWDLSRGLCVALDHCWTGSVEYKLGGSDGPPAPVTPRVPSRGTVLPQTSTE